MELFAGQTTIRARALVLGERIDVRALERTHRLGSAPLVVTAGERGAAVVFRYGAVVLFGVSPLEEVSLLQQLQPLVGEPLPKPEIEEIDVRVSPDKPEVLEGGALHLPAVTVERLQVTAEVLARSCALARYEAQVRESFAAIEAWAKGLEASGASTKLERQLRRHLGTTLLIQHGMAGRIEIGDNPDLLWERPDLERIYIRLVDEYELKEREKTLERKLALMTQTAGMLLDMQATKHSNRLEWYIISLIVFEILLSLFTMTTGIGR